MDCPNCHEPTEEGAVYCGNCGQPLRTQAAALGATGLQGALPSYASAVPRQRQGETQALIALLCGIAGLAGAIFAPVIGLGLGLAGLVLGTVSRVYGKKTLHFAGLFISSLAILAGLASWSHAVRNDPRTNPDVARAAPASDSVLVSAGLSTPCYSLNFVDELNISHDSGSCNMNAFNGKTLGGSTNVYKVFASKIDESSVNDFTNLIKPAMEKDIATTAPTFKVTSQKVSTFAGSPSFVMTASDTVNNVSLVESAVLHKVANGNNVFAVIHLNIGQTADLQILESQWQWK